MTLGSYSFEFRTLDSRMKRALPSGRGGRRTRGARFLRWLESQIDREDRIGNFARDVGVGASRHGLSDVDYLSHLGSGEIDAPEIREALFEAMTLWACSEGAPAFQPRSAGGDRSASRRAAPTRDKA